MEWEPGLRLQWRPEPTRMFWGAVSRAVRTPSRIDRDISQAAPPNLVLLRGGANFDPETVTAYELGFRAQPSPQFATGVALFYNRYDDVRSTSFTPTTILPFYFANNLEGETHGLELTADYQLAAWWRWHGSYDLLREHLHIKPGQADLNNARNETADPRQQLSLRSSIDLPHRVEFDAMFRWVDSLAINNGGAAATVPAYGELDLRLGWHPSEALELSLVGQNLLHAQHPDYGLAGPAREEIKRNVYAKVTWRF
jgi:iron complex outermembrane receptor protein